MTTKTKNVKYERKCKFCNKPFVSIQPTSKYCTPSHKQMDYIKRKREQAAGK
jgi:hypothetical protein